MKSSVTEENLASKTVSWMAQIAVYNRHPMSYERGSVALLVVDMQNFFLSPDSHAYLPHGKAIIPNVRGMIETFRRAGQRVIFTRHAHKPDTGEGAIMNWWWRDMCMEGTPDSEIHDELRPLSGEKVVTKDRYSAFFETDLEDTLRSSGIRDLVIAGVMTNLCCESTSRDAFYRDFRVTVLADGTGAVSEEMHVASLLNLSYGFANVTTVADVVDQLVDL